MDMRRRARSAEAGFDLLLVKPLKIADIIKMIASKVRGRLNPVTNL
jgi:hypothetical protein